jgi:hypothetical protein
MSKLKYDSFITTQESKPKKHKAKPNKICKKNYNKQQTCVLRFQTIKSDFQSKKYFKLCSHMNLFEIIIQTTNLT